MEPKKIYRSNLNKTIGGVCGGIAEFFNIDPVLIRVIFVLFGLFGAGILVYLILWIMIPQSPIQMQ